MMDDTLIVNLGISGSAQCTSANRKEIAKTDRQLAKEWHDEAWVDRQQDRRVRNAQKIKNKLKINKQ